MTNAESQVILVKYARSFKTKTLSKGARIKGAIHINRIGNNSKIVSGNPDYKNTIAIIPDPEIWHKDPKGEFTYFKYWIQYTQFLRALDTMRVGSVQKFIRKKDLEKLLDRYIFIHHINKYYE